MKRFLGLILVLALVCGAPAASAAKRGARETSQAPFEVYFLSQGRVDAILLRCGNAWAFIDSGFRINGVRSVSFMKKLGIEKLTYYIGSHGHENHIGGAGPIIAAFNPDRVYINRSATRSAIINFAQPGNERKAAMRASYKIMKRGSVIPFGPGAITCVGPLTMSNCSSGATSENANSLIFRVDYQGHSILFTGDSNTGVLNKIYQRDPSALAAEVFKNPHHHATMPQSILRRVKPAFVIVCSNQNASSTYRKRAQAMGITLLSNAKKLNRNIHLRLEGDTWVHVQAQPDDPPTTAARFLRRAAS